MYPSFLKTMEYEPCSTSLIVYPPFESVLVAYGVPSRKTSTPPLVLESPPRTTEPWTVPLGERTMEPRSWALPLRGETPVLIAPKETSSVVVVKALELVMFTSLSLFEEKWSVYFLEASRPDTAKSPSAAGRLFHTVLFEDSSTTFMYTLDTAYKFPFATMVPVIEGEERFPIRRLHEPSLYMYALPSVAL